MNISSKSGDSMRAVIYARNNNPKGLNGNVAQALALAARHGIPVVEDDVIAECASAATIDGRKKFAALLVEIEGGVVTHLITTGWDRLTRTGSDVPIVEAAFVASDVRLVTETGVEDYSRPSSIKKFKGMVSRLMFACTETSMVYGRVKSLAERNRREGWPRR